MNTSGALSILKEERDELPENYKIIIDGIHYTSSNYIDHPKERINFVVFIDHYVDEIHYFIDNNDHISVKLNDPNRHIDDSQCKSYILGSYIGKIHQLKDKLLENDSHTVNTVKNLMSNDHRLRLNYDMVMDGILNKPKITCITDCIMLAR